MEKEKQDNAQESCGLSCKEELLNGLLDFLATHDEANEKGTEENEA